MTQYCITRVLHNLNCICKRFISPGTSIDGVIDFIWPGEDFCATLWQSLTYRNCAPHPANPANQAASTTEKTDILFKSTWYFNPIENGGRILDAPSKFVIPFSIHGGIALLHLVFVQISVHFANPPGCIDNRESRYLCPRCQSLPDFSTQRKWRQDIGCSSLLSLWAISTNCDRKEIRNRSRMFPKRTRLLRDANSFDWVGFFSLS